MIDAKKFYINGEWITPSNSETIDVINPANEKVFTSIGSGCVNDINKAVDAAKEAFKIYSKTEIDERIILLKKIYNIYGHIVGEEKERKKIFTMKVTSFYGQRCKGVCKKMKDEKKLQLFL